MLAEVCEIVEGIIVINSRVLRKKQQTKAKTLLFFSIFFSFFFLKIFFPYIFLICLRSLAVALLLLPSSATMLLFLFGAIEWFYSRSLVVSNFWGTVVQLQSIFGARGDLLGSSLQKQIRTWWDIQF